MTSDIAIREAAGLRPWYRLHLSAWVVVALVSCGVLFVEVPAEVTVYYMHFPERGTQYQHGWPWVYVERWSSHGLSDPQNSIEPDAIPWLHAVCWDVSVPAGDVAKTRYCPRYIALDALVGVLVICAAGSLAEWWRRRRQRVWQFSLGDLLVGVLLCSTALGWWRCQHDRRRELFTLAKIPLPMRGGKHVTMREPTSGAFLDFGYAGPAWLARLVGKGPLEVFHEPVRAQLMDDDPAQAIRQLSKHKRLLPYLREISFGPLWLGENTRLAEVDQEVIRNLMQLGSVKSLLISGCRLDDRALYQLAEMPNLRQLCLSSCTGMTEAGIARLRANRTIEELCLFRTPLGPESEGKKE